jgi:hypothetical protein
LKDTSNKPNPICHAFSVLVIDSEESLNWNALTRADTSAKGQ